MKALEVINFHAQQASWELLTQVAKYVARCIFNIHQILTVQASESLLILPFHSCLHRRSQCFLDLFNQMLKSREAFTS